MKTVNQVAELDFQIYGATGKSLKLQQFSLAVHFMVAACIFLHCTFKFRITVSGNNFIIKITLCTTDLKNVVP